MILLPFLTAAHYIFANLGGLASTREFLRRRQPIRLSLSSVGGIRPSAQRLTGVFGNEGAQKFQEGGGLPFVAKQEVLGGGAVGVLSLDSERNLQF